MYSRECKAPTESVDITHLKEKIKLHLNRNLSARKIIYAYDIFQDLHSLILQSLKEG